jgi:hypothetical protein
MFEIDKIVSKEFFYKNVRIIMMTHISEVLKFCEKL